MLWAPSMVGARRSDMEWLFVQTLSYGSCPVIVHDQYLFFSSPPSCPGPVLAHSRFRPWTVQSRAVIFNLKPEHLALEGGETNAFYLTFFSTTSGASIMP